MNNIYEEITKLLKNSGQGVLVTVVEKKGHTPSQVQSKMLVFPDGTKVGTVGGGALEYAAEKMAPEILKTGKSVLKKYILNPDNKIVEGEQTGMVCGGETVLFYEFLGYSEKINIFGAGHIGKTLIYYLKNLNYNVNIFDSRQEMLEQIDCESVNNNIYSDYTDLEKYEEYFINSYNIIATHSHKLDYSVLKSIYKINSEPHYVGLIASRRKSKLVNENLRSDLPGINLENLYTPMGLDIGGASPHEIAISIISEIQAIRFNKTGHRHMRDR